MGSVFRQANRNRQTWMLRYYRHGRRVYESSGTTNQAAAKRLLRKREMEADAGLPLEIRVGRLRFEEAVAAVVANYQANGRKTTAKVQARIDRHLVPCFGNAKLAAITTMEIERFIAARLEAEAAAAEINRELAIVKRAYKLALKAGRLLAMPHIPMLDERNVRQGFFERDQFETIRRHLPASLRPVMTMAYLTGWRVASEVLPLQWHQVDRAHGTIRLEPGQAKNTEGRVFPYAEIPELRDTITAQWTIHEQLQKAGTIVPWVFHRDGKPIKSYAASWRTACVDAKLAGRIPHDFRRTAVRNLVRAGVPEKTAMALTGHKTRSVFDRYSIINLTDLRDAARKLGQGANNEQKG